MISLLDVNVLIALAWPVHLHHGAAHAWFARNHERGWATCNNTQAGFLRVSTMPQAVKTIVGVAEAFQVLEHSMKSPHHHFWPHPKSIADLHPIVKGRIMGPKQVADAILLDLAIENGGCLATFDKRIIDLLPAGSPLRNSVEILPI